MKQIMCSRCHKRPAVFFISKIDGDKSTQEGLCIKCATEMNIGPVKQMLQNMGISDEDIEGLNEQLETMLEDENFEPGGAGTLPFLQNFAQLGGDDDEKKEDAPPQEKKRKKHRE